MAPQIPASVAVDLWQFGCVMYHLATGRSLFHASEKDNLDPAQLRVLAEWSDDTKQERLDMVQDRKCRNLISRLLHRDPLSRPDSFARVVCHPFFTGKTASRLVGEEADYDCFLSYRVRSDLESTKRLYHELLEQGVRVWWDKECLEKGKQWEDSFCSGLVRSRVFLPIISEGSVKGMKSLKQDSPCDNVLLELRLALELRELGMCEGVFPILLGQLDETTGVRAKFRWGALEGISGEVVDSIEDKVGYHLEREGLGVPIRGRETPKDTIAKVTEYQGSFIFDQPQGGAQNTSFLAAALAFKDIVSAVAETDPRTATTEPVEAL